MLIKRIQEDPILSEFICDDCEENGVGINVSKDVNRSSFIIIRVDEFYNKTIHDNALEISRLPDYSTLRR
jgi:uncharacterized protein YlaI